MPGEEQPANVFQRLARAAVSPLRLYPSAIAAGLLMGTVLLVGNLIPRPSVEVHLSALPAPHDQSPLLIPRWDSGWPCAWRHEADAEFDSRPQILAPAKATVGISAAAIALDVAVIVGGAFLAAAAFQTWRSWRQAIWQLHLRDLLALTAATAIIVSWVLGCRSAGKRQETIVAALRSPQIRYWSGSGPPQDSIRWLRVSDSPWPLLSGESGRCVVGLEADGDELHLAALLPQLRALRVNRGATSEQLQELTRLTRLESLHVVSSPRPVAMSLEQLDPTASIPFAKVDSPPPPLESQPELVLPPLRSLRALSIASTPFRGAGLARLSRLETLDLTGTLVDDAGLKGLRGLTRLRLLSLSRTPITSAGLEHLRGLSELEELSLSSTRVTAAGLAHLAKLPRLSRLSLIGVDSDDEMVRVLAQFPALAELRIEGPQLTGRSVHALSQMRLKQLTIHNTSLPAVDVRHLQFALPDCAVHIYPFLPPWPASP